MEDVKGFFDTYYVPGNASLVVAGDFDPAEAKKLSPPPRSAPCPCGRCPNTAPRCLSRSNARCAAWPPTACAFRASTWCGTRRRRTRMAMPTWTSSSVLAAGTTGRLVERLVMKEQLAQQVQVYQDSRELGSEFHIEATAAEGADLEHIKQVTPRGDRAAAEGRPHGRRSWPASRPRPNRATCA
ncbi:MAG: insulinase family protein [bacterium]|nr:insulinase family protein [bacterium]